MRAINFLLLVAFAASSAHAAPAVEEETISITAGLRGMQLTNEADVRRLDRRVSRLASAVCFPPGNRGVRDGAAFNHCRTAAMRGAKRQIEVAIAAAKARGNTRLAAAE